MYCGIFNENLLQIYCWVCLWKNFKISQHWLRYRQESWLPHALSVSGHCPVERWRTRQISWVWQETAATLIHWFRHGLVNYQTDVGQFCFANWHHQRLWLNVDDVQKGFCFEVFFSFVAAAAYSQSLFQLLGKYLLVSELYVMLTSLDKYFFH